LEVQGSGLQYAGWRRLNGKRLLNAVLAGRALPEGAFWARDHRHCRVGKIAEPDSGAGGRIDPERLEGPPQSREPGMGFRVGIPARTPPKGRTGAREVAASIDRDEELLDERVHVWVQVLRRVGLGFRRHRS